MTFYIYKDSAGYWRWTLTANNNRKIANFELAVLAGHRFN